MSVVVTMAGLGSRFTEGGYTVPKYQIQARGRSLFEWSLLSLSAFFEQEFILATLKGEDEHWLRDAANRIGIGNLRIEPREGLSRGQAHTAFDAAAEIADTEPLWIYNIDTYLEGGPPPVEMAGLDGCIPVFESSDPGMSFVRDDPAGFVQEVAEKKVISHWASVGLYGFRSTELFRSLYREAYHQHRLTAVAGEEYVAPIYGLALRAGARIKAPRIPAANVYILGTPPQLLRFDGKALPPVGNPGPPQCCPNRLSSRQRK